MPPHPRPQAAPHATPTTDHEIEEAVLALVREARRARSPGRSLGALIRWRCREQGWPDALCDRLLDLGMSELNSIAHSDEMSADVPPPAFTGHWLTIEGAAAMTNRSPDTIRRKLRTLEGRRDYGWPWWDGHRWLIPSPAVDPLARATYMASLPEQEPYPPPPFADS